ncbi:MAG: TolC family protein [Bacteroidota bacterium]
MNNLKLNYKVLVVIVMIMSTGFLTQAQNSTDSLTLSKIISIVIENHPAIKGAEEAVKGADAGIGLANADYYPKLDADASYTRIGPVQSLSMPGFGTFDLFPPDNYNANVQYNQTVYNFGKTAKNVAFANEAKNLSKEILEQLKQKLASAATLRYYSLVYLQEALAINNKQLQTFKEHLDFVEKKQASGSATQYEILSTKVKISTIESNILDLQSHMKNTMTELNELMGLPGKSNFTVTEDFGQKIPALSEDSLLAYAYEHRDEIRIAKEKTSLNELKYKLIKAENNPSLNVHLSGGGKNGFFPDLNVVKANYVAALELRIPIFDGTKTKYHLIQAGSAIKITEFETVQARQAIIADLAESQENVKSSLKKIDHFNLQLSQSQEAYRLAQLNFKAGVITNLDLLDAATNISDSSLLLLKAKIEYITNVFRLRVSIGERIY